MTGLSQWNNCVGMKNEALCGNEYANKFTDLSVDCGTLRIIEFDMKLLDCSKKPTLWTWAAKTTLAEDSSWFNIHWTASTV